MEKYDLIIVGAGPAGIFTAVELLRHGSKKKMLLVEKGKPVEKRHCPKAEVGHCVNCRPTCAITTGFSGAGAFSDGKLSLSYEVGGDLPTLIGEEFAQELIDYTDKIYLEFGADPHVEGIYTGEDIKEIRKNAIHAGLKLVDCPIRHLGTEKAQELYLAIQNYLADNGVEMRFNTECENIILEEEGCKGVLLKDGDSLLPVYADEVVIGTGRRGADWLERLCAELIEYFRGLMIVKSVEKPDDLIVAPPAEIARMREEAAAFSLPAILHCMDVLQQSLERLRGGVSRRVEMEMALLKLCTPELDVSPESMLRRLKSLEDAVRAGQAAGAVSPAVPAGREAFPPPPAADEPPPPWEEAPPAPSTASVSGPQPAPVREPPGEEAGAEQPMERWNDVLDGLSASCPPLYGVLLGSTAAMRGDLVLISAPNDMFRALVTRDGNKAALTAAIRAVTGRPCRIGIRKTAPSPAKEEDDPLAAFIRSSRELGVDITVKD